MMNELEKAKMEFAGLAERHGIPKVDKWDGVPKEWVQLCERGLKPAGIPDRPDIDYGDAWEGWEDFFGKHGLRTDEENERRKNDE